MKAEDVKSLSERWRVAPYFYSILSFGGRSQPESKLLVKLAAALAYISAGYIVVTNNNLFALGMGVYTPDEFKDAEPKF